MSLTYTWVLADNGWWYREPTLADVTNRWFICFDDDDPPEFIVKQPDLPKGSRKQQAMEYVQVLLESLHIPGASVQGWNEGGGRRCFPGNQFYPAIAVWLRLTEPIPSALIVTADLYLSLLAVGRRGSTGVIYNFGKSIQPGDRLPVVQNVGDGVPPNWRAR